MHEPPPEIPGVRETLAFDSDPPWGEGHWSRTNEFYKLFYSIEVAS